jgi:hypothetical protein
MAARRPERVVKYRALADSVRVYGPEAGGPRVEYVKKGSIISAPESQSPSRYWVEVDETNQDIGPSLRDIPPRLPSTEEAEAEWAMIATSIEEARDGRRDAEATLQKLGEELRELSTRPAVGLEEVVAAENIRRRVDKMQADLKDFPAMLHGLLVEKATAAEVLRRCRVRDLQDEIQKQQDGLVDLAHSLDARIGSMLANLHELVNEEHALRAQADRGRRPPVPRVTVFHGIQADSDLERVAKGAFSYGQDRRWRAANAHRELGRSGQTKADFDAEERDRQAREFAELERQRAARQEREEQRAADRARWAKQGFDLAPPKESEPAPSAGADKKKGGR